MGLSISSVWCERKSKILIKLIKNKIFFAKTKARKIKNKPFSSKLRVLQFSDYKWGEYFQEPDTAVVANLHALIIDMNVLVIWGFNGFF